MKKFNEVIRDNGVFVVICRPEHLRSTLATFPKKLQAQIKKDPAYGELNFPGNDARGRG